LKRSFAIVNCPLRRFDQFTENPLLHHRNTPGVYNGLEYFFIDSSLLQLSAPNLGATTIALGHYR
jgi:hypothetical protein